MIDNIDSVIIDTYERSLVEFDEGLEDIIENENGIKVLLKDKVVMYPWHEIRAIEADRMEIEED